MWRRFSGEVLFHILTRPSSPLPELSLSPTRKKTLFFSLSYCLLNERLIEREESKEEIM